MVLTGRRTEVLSVVLLGVVVTGAGLRVTAVVVVVVMETVGVVGAVGGVVVARVLLLVGGGAVGVVVFRGAGFVVLGVLGGSKTDGTSRHRLPLHRHLGEKGFREQNDRVSLSVQV